MPLAGKPMLTLCAKLVVVKAALASIAEITSVNFMVVEIGESLELIDSLYNLK